MSNWIQAGFLSLQSSQDQASSLLGSFISAVIGSSPSSRASWESRCLVSHSCSQDGKAPSSRSWLLRRLCPHSSAQQWCLPQPCSLPRTPRKLLWRGPTAVLDVGRPCSSLLLETRPRCLHPKGEGPRALFTYCCSFFIFRECFCGQSQTLQHPGNVDQGP